MSLVSFEFLLFILAVGIVYYILPQKAKWPLLLVASLAFAAAAGIYTLGFLLISAVTTFIGGHIAGKGKSRAGKTAGAVIAIVLNIGLLCAVKYYNLLEPLKENLNNILHASDGSILAFAVPLGMSFYTLQMTGYVLDCLWGKIEPEKNIFKYLLWATYFPYITSGPINRYAELSAEFSKAHKFDIEKLKAGSLRIAWGFFKKLVIAERAASWTNAVYAAPADFGGIYIVLGVIAFAVQLYADFSGCMDVVIGASAILDIKLPENFNSPYFAGSIREYWRRWHSTLGDFLQDYLFYPVLKTGFMVSLGDKAKEFYIKKYGKKEGKRKGKQVPVYLAMLILWFAVGYWHGGVWKYIIGSGLLHCFYIVSGMLAEPLFEKIRPVLKADKLPFKIWRVVRTFILVLLGFVFFRSADVPAAIEMLKALFKPALAVNAEGIYSMGLELKDIIVLIISLLILGGVDLYKFRENDAEEPRSVIEAVSKTPAAVKWIVFTGLAAAVHIFGMYGLGYEAGFFIYASI